MTTTQSIAKHLKPIGDRLIFKGGAANVCKEHVDRKTLRFFKDIFTSLIDLRWFWTLLIFCSCFIVSWTFFACLWFSLSYAKGDIAWYNKWLNAEDPESFARENPRTPCVRNLYSFVSAFLFSIETQHTIGFGFRYVTEQCAGGPILLISQSITGSLIEALLMGVIIAKLARPEKRAQNVIFSKNAVICYRDGILCLVFRIGDLRKSYIIQSKVTARLIKKHMTKEGELIVFHQQELKLSADGCNEQLMLMWPTFVVHKIDKKSPLYGKSAYDIQREQFEIIVILDGGVESTGLQTQVRVDCLGCKSCDCAVASNSTQCDDHTGDCRCKPGVTGRQCDRCLPGYWNYTSEGCLPCSCNTDYSRGLGCNAQTGQCECLPGVVGEKCDACPHRWVLIPDTGCHVCDICHHALLDFTDRMRDDLDPVIEEFQTVAGGYFTAQKLNYYNDLVEKLVPQVRALDPNGVNLTPSMNAIEALELDTKNINRRVQFAEQRAKELSENGNKLINSSSDVLDGSRFALNNVKNTIKEVEKLADSFDASESTDKAEIAIAEASEILQLIQNHMVDSLPTNKQLEDAEIHLENIERFSDPVKEQNLKLEALRSEIGSFSDKMEDLFDWSIASNDNSLKAQLLHSKNKAATLNLKFDTVANQSKDAWKNINGTDLFGKKGDVTMGEIYRHLKSLENVNNELKEVCQQVDKKLPQQDEDMQKLDETIDQATENQNKLLAIAKELSSELSNVTANSEMALKAANAYTDIVEAVSTAQKAVKNAKMAAGNATELCDGIEDRAGAGDQVARDMLDQARKSLNTVQLDLQPHLNTSTQEVDNIYQLNQKSEDQTTAINIALDQIKPDSQAEVWREARDNAINAQEKAQEALNILNPIVKGLPDELIRAKQMPKEVDDTNKDIAQASKQVERVMNLFPNLQALVDDLGERQEKTDKLGSDLADRIDRLKRQIEMARDVANSIKVGVNFHPNTTLELKPPSNLNQLATTSRVSAFVKTDKPNGFLLYLGNENKSGARRNKRDDFMALEVENGYPILTIDLGNGPERIIGNKYIANDQWHQVIVERTGKNGK